MTKRNSLAGLLIAGALGLSGCNDTLVFTEHTGFDLAINVNDDPRTPLHVNAGLERQVGAFVPPRDVTQDGQGQTKAVGEAVSLFSGFRLKDENTSVLNPFNGKLTIRTQFASGRAAINIAGDPVMVGKIVDVSFNRDAEFVQAAREKRVDAILDGLTALYDDRKFAVLISLSANPPVNDPAADNLVRLRIKAPLPTNDPTTALAILKTRAAMSRRDDAALKAWEAALQAAQ